MRYQRLRIKYRMPMTPIMCMLFYQSNKNVQLDNAQELVEEANCLRGGQFGVLDGEEIDGRPEEDVDQGQEDEDVVLAESMLQHLHDQASLVSIKEQAPVYQNYWN